MLPGYYSDGRTWISIDLEADLPTGVVLDLCDMSYGLVFAKLPKRVQREIAAEHPHGSPLADGRIALRRAELSDVGAIASVVAETIRSVYPRYHPEPVVAKFLELHSEDAIAEDIRGGKVVVAVADVTIVGTGTVEGSHISRVFVLPGFQGRGVGSAILDELEERSAASRGAAIVESSLPACSLYERRGYRTVTHGSWDIPSADGLPAATLVWEVMEKDLRLAHGRGDGLDRRRDDLASRRGGATNVPMA